VGLDICAAAGKSLAGADAKPPACLVKRLEANKLGKKSGEGFYRYEKGKAVKGQAGPVTDDLIERLIAPYLAEARKTVDEKIVADAELADGGLIFGTGFAPFRGGPMHYLAERGKA
jgi:3-hydroxyacyl-CoA dehydrogenase/enoyl-CoA hydratase/3-hydroxybutyryl-CoA epimerase